MFPVGHKAAASMVEVLTPIWQRVLGRPSVGGDANFFDLGGTPAQAVKMFSELAQVTGRDLTPVAILHAPTIDSLAAVLDRPAPVRLSTVVRMKDGTADPPVFLAAGLGGSLLDLLQLSRHLESSHPIYGLVAKGIDGADDPFDRVEDMAQYYLDAIKKVQPRGPYILIGGSFGGLVMLELAQCLAGRGEQIGLLVLLDSYPHSRFLSLRLRTRLARRRITNRLSTLMRLPRREALSYVVHRIRGQLVPPDDRSRLVADRLAIGVTLSPAMRRLRDSDYLALSRYQPSFYKGRIRFVRAGSGSHFPDNAVAVWAPLANEFEVETVPGDHREMITTHFETLASALSRYLQEAFSQGRKSQP